jgi:hypothetical protein
VPRLSTTWPCLGELHGVAQQVDQHLLQAQRIALQQHTVAEQARVVEPAKQLQALLLRALTHQAQRACRQFVDPEGRGLQRHAARLDLAEVEDVVDELQQVLRGAQALVQVVALQRLQFGGQRELGHAHDGVHGGADLVAHVRQEGRLGARGGLGLVARQGHLGLRRVAAKQVLADGLGHVPQGGGEGGELGDLPGGGVTARLVAASGIVVGQLHQVGQRQQHAPPHADHGQAHQGHDQHVRQQRGGHRGAQAIPRHRLVLRRTRLDRGPEPAHRLDQVRTQRLVFGRMHQLDGVRAVRRAVVDDLAGLPVVQALGGRKGDFSPGPAAPDASSTAWAAREFRWR